MLLLVLIILFVALLGVASLQVVPRIRRGSWKQSRPIWFNDLRGGDVIREDERFKRPPNENDLL